MKARHIFLILIVATIIAAVVVSSSVGNSKTAQRFAAITAATPYPKLDEMLNISGEELLDAYKANEVAAKLEYDGKRVAITGTVEGITQSKDTITITMPIFEVTDKGVGKHHVLCHFDVKHAKEIAKLVKGDVVTVSGICDGLTILFDDIKLNDCRLEA